MPGTLAEYRFDHGWFVQSFGWSMIDNFPIETECCGRIVGEGLEIVRNEENSFSVFTVEPAEEREECFFCSHIDTRRRFIENEEGWIGEERLSDKNPLLLATGEFADTAREEMTQADNGDGSFEVRTKTLLFAGVPAETIALPASGDNFGDCRGKVRIPLKSSLGNVADLRPLPEALYRLTE
jgi:hypothetical protein